MVFLQGRDESGLPLGAAPDAGAELDIAVGPLERGGLGREKLARKLGSLLAFGNGRLRDTPLTMTLTCGANGELL